MCGGHDNGGELAHIDITQLGWWNAAPKDASSDTGPYEIGTCDAVKVTMWAACSRNVPTSLGLMSKSASTHHIQRRNDAQCVAEATPIVLLMRLRTEASL